MLSTYAVASQYVWILPASDMAKFYSDYDTIVYPEYDKE